MTKPTEDGPPSPSLFLRRALAHALGLGGREIRIRPAEVVLLDRLGRQVRLERGGEPESVDPAALADHLGQRGAWPGRRPAGDAVALDGLGTWSFRTERDGSLTLRARRPPAPCLEALFEAPADELAALRGLYRHDGIDVHVHCQGETRARDLALAIVSERRLLGLPTSFVPDLARERSYRDGSGVLAESHFDACVGHGPAWEVREAPKARYGDRPRTRAFPESGSGVVVTASDPVPWHIRGRDSIADGVRPAASLIVTIESSTPVGRVLLSPAARALSDAAAPFADAPWDAFLARRESHRASRPAKPRTWHRTTAAVAAAFAARLAPRGLLSGQALYFHGPVAYSLHDGNPVAAFVATPDGLPLILTGRGPDRGGTKTQIVTEAKGDIARAAEGVRRIGVGNLVPLLRLGGTALDRVPASQGRETPGDGLPREATVLPEALSAWVSARYAAACAELDEAYVTRFPTQRQASAYASLARHARKRDALGAALGLALPEVGDAADFEGRASAALAAADRRQAELKARAALREVAERAAGAPAPGMAR